MSLRTRGMVPLIAIVAAAMALAATSAVSMASNTAGKDVDRTTMGVSAALDTLPPAGTTEPAPAGLQPMDGDGDGHGWWNSGWWVVMPVMMVIFWGSIIALVVWGIRQFTRDRERGRSPLDIAKERLARGEITKEEFDRIRGDLA